VTPATNDIYVDVESGGCEEASLEELSIFLHEDKWSIMWPIRFAFALRYPSFTLFDGTREEMRPETFTPNSFRQFIFLGLFVINLQKGLHKEARQKFVGKLVRRTQT
jgi:hypothetical protein